MRRILVLLIFFPLIAWANATENADQACENALVGSLRLIIQDAYKNGDLTIDQLRTVAESQNPQNPLPKNGLKAHQALLRKAIDRSLGKVTSEEWNEIRKFAYETIGQNSSDQETRQEASKNTSVLVSPTMVTSYTGSTSIRDMGWDPADRPTLEFYSYDDTARWSQEGINFVHYKNSSSFRFNRSLKNSLGFESQFIEVDDPVSFGWDHQSSSYNGVAVRLSFEKDKVTNKHFDHRLHFVFYNYNYHHESGSFKQVGLMENVRSTGLKKCLSQGDFIDCLVVNEENKVFLVRVGRDKTFEVLSIEFSTNIRGIDLAHLPDGNPVVAIGDGNQISIIRPLQPSAAPVTIPQPSNELQWLVVDEQNIFLRIKPEYKARSFLVRPFEKDLEKFPLPPLTDIRDWKAMKTSDGQIWVAVRGSKEVQILTLLNFASGAK